MNPFFARIPLVRLLLPLTLGIAFAYVSGIYIGLPVFLFGIFPAILLLAYQRKLLRRSLNWSGFDGVTIATIFFFSGAALTSQEISSSRAIVFPKEEKTAAFLVRLLNDPVEKERSVKCCVEVLAWKDSVAQWQSCGGKLMLYLAREDAASQLQYGDELLLHAASKAIPPPQNPGEFDYRSWLARQNVYRQSYVRSGEWRMTSRGNGNWFKASALQLRRYFLGKLQQYGINGPEGGVAAALLLGASDHLDPGLLQAYSASGTLHVLSVSGMHVALVYLVLLKLLSPLEKRKYGKWISIGIQFFFLWFYAALTGLCPSVLRSVTMLSVVIAGRAFGRQAHILNSLAASALILLLIDPLLLLDVGFQLSYLAVAGIVLLQPRLEKHWEPRFWITQQIWSLVTVTIVAQVFTFPLGLYYFRQFPSYFLLSNLVVIPLSTITMYAGLAFLFLSPIAFLAKWAAVILVFCIQLLDLSVTWIERLPQSVLRSAEWQLLELLFLYAVVITMLFFLVRKRVRWLNVALGGVLLLLFSFTSGKRQRLDGSQLVFFRVDHATAIGVAEGDRYLLLADTALTKKQGGIDFHIRPFFEDNGCYEEQVVPLPDSVAFRNTLADYSGEWLQACGKKIFIAGKTTQKENACSACDILLLRENTRLPLDTLLSRLQPSLVIADGSDGKKRTQQWKTICEKRSVRFYDVKENGALIVHGDK